MLKRPCEITHHQLVEHSAIHGRGAKRRLQLWLKGQISSLNGVPRTRVFHWTFVGVVLALLACRSISPSAYGAPAAPKNSGTRQFHENVTFPADSNLRKRFLTVTDLIRDERWNEVINILQEVSQTENKSLVLVREGEVGGCATYVNVATYCNLLLAKLPHQGRQEYRSRIDPQAKRWYANWLRTRDESELQRIVRQAFLSSYGDDALLALGESAWDRGDFSAARLWWEQLIPLPHDANPAEYVTVLRYPDASIDRATILARIAICSVMQNETGRASDELKQLIDRYPLATGWIAGKSGRLVDGVLNTLEESKAWKRAQPHAEVATFALSPDRGGVAAESVDVGALRWIQPLSPNLLPRHPQRLSFPDESLSYHPVVYDKIVLVNDSESIRAWNILTGDPAWQSERRDPAVIYPAVPDEAMLPPDKVCVGVPHYTMTIADGRLYARMGSPITCASTAELRRELASDLVCLDLTQEGKLAWKISAQELVSDDPPWRYEGSPVIVAGRAYMVLCRRHPQLELMVVSLDTANGRLIWQRPVGAFRTSVDDNNNRVSHLLLTAGGGRIFLSTDAGAILALDAQDGRIEWAISYESRIDENSTAITETGVKELTPALFHAGLLFVAPHDCRSAFCIEADSGRVDWQHSYLRPTPRETPDMLRREEEAERLRRKQWRHLLGVVPGGSMGRLIISSSSLSSIDIQTGRVIWERNNNASPRGSRASSGRGLIANDEIFLPLRESIEIFNAKSGELLRQIPLKTPSAAELGGNLTLAGGMLLIAQSNRLAAFCEYSRLKERMETELTLRPDDASLRIQLAELEAAEGQLDSAASSLRQVLENTGSNEPARAIVRRKLSRLLRDASLAEVNQHQLEDARTHLTQALTYADDVVARVELAFELARIEDSLEQPDATLLRLQTILNDENLASARFENSTARDAAAEKISQLIAAHGRDIYRQVEDQAKAEFEELAKYSDRAGLRRLSMKYPHATTTIAARQMLAQLHHAAGEVSEAFTILSQIRQNATDDRTNAITTLQIINLLESAGYGHSVIDFCRPLVNGLSTGTLSDEVKDLQVVATAKLQIERLASHVEPNLFERTWDFALSVDDRAIVPQFEAPAAKLASILVCSRHQDLPDSWLWRCIDTQTGLTRWEEVASSPIQLACWTPVHLLIGTPRGWHARCAENGRQIWNQSTNADSVPRLERMVDDAAWPMSFDVERGLQLFDPNDGRQIAIIKPADRLHSVFGIARSPINSSGPATLGESSYRLAKADAPLERSSHANNDYSILMQTLRPTRTWRVSTSVASGPWKVEEVSTGGEPWKNPPIDLNGHIIGLTEDHHLTGLVPVESKQRTRETNVATATNTQRRFRQWKYDHLAIGQASPIALPCRNDLLLVVDGLQLASFNSSNGSRKWSVRLASFPLRDPGSQVCVDDDRIVAASQGMLRSIAINNGQVQWEKYLGEIAPQWHTAVVWHQQLPHQSLAADLSDASKRLPRKLIATWPIAVNQKHQTIRFCDAATGEILQLLHVGGEPQQIMLNRDGTGILQTSESLVGLRFALAQTIAQTGEDVNNSPN